MLRGSGDEEALLLLVRVLPFAPLRIWLRLRDMLLSPVDGSVKLLGCLRPVADRERRDGECECERGDIERCGEE